MAHYVVDTNILIRLITFDVPTLAEEAEAMIDPLGDNMIELPLYVLSEAVYVLAYNQHYRYSRQRITDSLFGLIGLRQFQLNRGLVGQALNTFNLSKLDFVDCLLLCQSRQSGQSLMTFDKDLKRAL